MIEGSEKGRATTGQGRDHGPTGGNRLWEAGCVLGPSHAGSKKVVSPEATRQMRSRLFVEDTERATATDDPATGREGGLDSGEAPLDRGRTPTDRSEGRPPGRTDLPSGAVRFAVDAYCCGALGCHERDGLLRVEQDGETRTLCPYHARRWVQ